MLCINGGTIVNSIINCIESVQVGRNVLYLGHIQICALNKLDYKCQYLERDHWGKSLKFMGHDIVEVVREDYLRFA